MSVHHVNGMTCPKCEEMLSQANPRIAEWFRTFVLKHFPGAHIYCSFRGKEDQDKDFESGKSKLRWPNSKHNATNPNGRPEAKALDLFFLSDDGKALFPLNWYKNIFATSVDFTPIPIRWGGTFKTLGDSNHFELA